MALELDHHDHRILIELQNDARLSMAELGRRVNLSQPAVTERVRRLEDKKVIRAYRAKIDSEALGYQIRAIVRIAGYTPNFSTIVKLIEETPEVLSAYNVTGEDSWVMDVVVANVRHLDEVVSKFSDIAETSTSIVLRAVKDQAGIVPLRVET